MTGADAADGVPEELRALAERLRPWLERLAAAQPGDGHADPGPVRCPLCALLAALRGERPEVVLRLVEHSVGLLMAARDLLVPPAEGQHGHSGCGKDRAGPERRVQHIPVRPAGTGAASPEGTAGADGAWPDGAWPERSAGGETR